MVTALAHLVPAALESAARYAAAASATSSRRTYAQAWGAWEVWAGAQPTAALPALPVAVATYLAHLADEGLAPATVTRHAATISREHRRAGEASPCDHVSVRAVLAGIRRTLGTAQRRVAPMLPGGLRAAARSGREDAIGIRDRALLAVGFAGGFRRSALVALEVADLAWGTEGVTATIRRDKTDQEAAGRTVALPYGSDPATCPVRTLRAWLACAGITSGPVFRAVDRHGRVGAEALSDRSVANIVKAAAERAGLSPESYSGHSLRAGLATAAAQAGKSDRAIMRTTGHRSRAMVDRYIREADLFRDCAASGIGL